MRCDWDCYWSQLHLLLTPTSMRKIPSYPFPFTFFSPHPTHHHCAKVVCHHLLRRTPSSARSEHTTTTMCPTPSCCYKSFPWFVCPDHHYICSCKGRRRGKRSTKVQFHFWFKKNHEIVILYFFAPLQKATETRFLLYIVQRNHIFVVFSHPLTKQQKHNYVAHCTI